MKLKIISDGTNVGTKLVDEDTGQAIGLIQKLTWEGDAKDVLTKITVEFVNIPVEITTKAEVELLDYDKDFNLKLAKTFEKEVKITSTNQANNTFAQLVKISDTATNEQIGAIQNIKWEATPQSCSAKISKIKFDKKDW